MVSFSDFYPCLSIDNSEDRIIFNVTLIIASFDQKPTNILNFLLFVFEFFFIALIFLYSLVPQYLTKLLFAFLKSFPNSASKRTEYSLLSFLCVLFASNPVNFLLYSPGQECSFFSSCHITTSCPSFTGLIFSSSHLFPPWSIWKKKSREIHIPCTENANPLFWNIYNLSPRKWLEWKYLRHCKTF